MQDLKVAVIVNDMSEVNIGASMIKRRHTLSKTEKTDRNGGAKRKGAL